MAKQTLQQLIEEHGGPIKTLRETSGQSLNPGSGYEYTSWIEEQRSWRESCYLGDWSFMDTVRFKGPEALELFADLTANSFENFSIGKAKHAVQCNSGGNVISDGVLMRTGENELIMQGGTMNWPIYNIEANDYNVTANHEGTFIYQVQGPTALSVFEDLVDDDLTDIGFMNFTNIRIHGYDIRALRHGMAGEAGFELHGPAEVGDEIYQAIFEAGQSHGIRRLGERTQAVTRIVIGLPQRSREYMPAIYGDDMREYRNWLTTEDREATHSIDGSFDAEKIDAWYRNPFELGWGNYIDFDHDFVGREALKDTVNNQNRSLVTLVWDKEDLIDVYTSLFGGDKIYKYINIPMDNTVKMEANKVLKDGELIGVSTGHGYSYNFREMLSLCTIDTEFKEPGTQVKIIWGDAEGTSGTADQLYSQREISAKVAPAPIKKDNRKGDFSSFLSK